MPDEVAATKESLEWFRTAREKWEQSKLSRRALRKLEPVIDKEATIDTSIQNPFSTVTSSGIIPKPESTQTGTNTVVDSRAGSSSERSHPFQSSSSKAAIHPPAVLGFKAPAVLNPFSFSGREGATGSSSGSEQKEDEVFGSLKGLSFCTDETEIGQTPFLAASPIVPTSTPFSFSPPEKEKKNAKNKRDAAPAFSTGKAPAFSVSTPAPTMEDNNKKNHPNAFSFVSTTIGSSSGAFSGSRAFSVSSSKANDASQTGAFGSPQPPTSNPFSFATKMASTIEPPSATKTIAAGANQPTADTGNVTVDTAASTKRTSPFGSTKTNDTLSTPFSFSTLATGKIPSSPVNATSTGTSQFGQSTANPPSNPSPFAPTASGKRVEESSDSTDKYRERLVAFYELHNPAKLSSVDETLKKYAGKEEELFSKLKGKYKYPPPTGKGPRVFFDIEYKGETITVQMELFADKTPVAAENFRCLCTGEKGIGRGGKPLCYKGNKFHRIVRNMCLQGGDITVGNGTGGESIYQPRTPGVNLWGDFEDEMFLSHAKPGLLSMANKGKDTNNSQFFITLRALASLNGKHVVFGQIVSGMQDVQRIAASIKLDGDQPEESVIVVDCGEIKTEDGKEVFHRASDRTQSNSSFDGSGTNGGGFSGFGSGTSPFGPAGGGSSLFGGGGTPFGGLKSAPSIFGRPVGQVTGNNLVTKTVYAKVTDGERRADRDSSIEENAIEICSPGPKGSTTLNLTAVLQPNETTAVNSKSDTGILTDHTKLDTSNLSNEYHESDSSTPYYDVPLVPVCGVIPIFHSDIRESQLVNETMPGKSSRHSESRVDESTDDSDSLINSIATFESVVSEQIESLQRDIRESSMQIKTTKARLEKQQELISSRMGASLSPRRNTNALYLSSNQSTPSALSENEGQRRNFARGDVCSPSTLHPVNDESLSPIAKVVTISNLESSELDTRAEDICSHSPSNTDNDADHHLVEPVELLCELEASTIDDPARDPGVAANATSEYSYEAALLFRQSGKVGSERKNRPSSKIPGAGVTDDTLVEWQNKSSRSTTVVSPKIAARDSFSTHVLVNTETLTKLQREKKCVKPLIGKFDAWTKSHVSKQEHT